MLAVAVAGVSEHDGRALLDGRESDTAWKVGQFRAINCGQEDFCHELSRWQAYRDIRKTAY